MHKLEALAEAFQFTLIHNLRKTSKVAPPQSLISFLEKKFRTIKTFRPKPTYDRGYY